MTPRPNRSGPCCSERGAAAGAARHRVTDAHDHTAHFVQREKGQRGTHGNTESESKRPPGHPCHELLPPPSHPPKPAPAPGHEARVAPWRLRARGGRGRAGETRAKGCADGAGSRVPMARGHLGEGAGGAPVPILVPEWRRRRRRRRRRKNPCGSALTLEETAQSHLVDF